MPEAYKSKKNLLPINSLPIPFMAALSLYHRERAVLHILAASSLKCQTNQKSSAHSHRRTSAQYVFFPQIICETAASIASSGKPIYLKKQAYTRTNNGKYILELPPTSQSRNMFYYHTVLQKLLYSLHFRQ